MTSPFKLTDSMIDAYDRDGVVFLPGLFSGWVDRIRQAIEENMTSPGPYAAENTKDGESGRFLTITATGNAFPPLPRS